MKVKICYNNAEDPMKVWSYHVPGYGWLYAREIEFEGFGRTHFDPDADNGAEPRAYVAISCEGFSPHDDGLVSLW